MSNPYQSPAVETAWTTPSLDLASLAPLQGAILTLRIVVATLAMGVVAFGAFTIVRNFGKAQVFGGNLDPVNITMLALGLLGGVMGIVLPGVLFRFVKPDSATIASFATHPPEVVHILTVQSRIQTATIVGCAAFEGGAFANLVGYMMTSNLLHLAVAGLLLLGILARFPLPGRCERQIEDELRREKEEAGFRPG